jgi:hypothetical protein
MRARCSLLLMHVVLVIIIACLCGSAVLVGPQKGGGGTVLLPPDLKPAIRILCRARTNTMRCYIILSVLYYSRVSISFCILIRSNFLRVPAKTFFQRSLKVECCSKKKGTFTTLNRAEELHKRFIFVKTSSVIFSFFMPLFALRLICSVSNACLTKT